MKLSFFGSRSVPTTLPILLGMVIALCATWSAKAQYVVSNLWEIPTGIRDYVTSGVTERGVAYNPLTHHVILVSRTSTLRIFILDAETGAEIGTMNVSGVTGGTFPLSMIGVAEDGAIYAGNLSGSATTGVPVYRLYRWQDETSEPVQVFTGNPAGVGSATVGRWGDHMDVRGAGVNTEILITSEGPVHAAILKPTDDTMTAFVTAPINLAPVAVSEIRAVAFGTNNTFFGKRHGNATLRLFSYDLSAGTGSVIATYTVNASTIGLSYETNSALLSAVQTGGTGAAHNLLVYNVAVGGTLPLVASFPFPNPVAANGNAVGSSDFVYSNIVALATANGIVMARSFFKPEPTIGVDPPNTNVVQGGYITLSADAGGVPPLTFQWHLDGQPVEGGTNRLLTLTNVTLSQQGDYTIAVSNAFGGVVSDPGTLTVVPTVLSDAMTLLWHLPPDSRPYINTDNSQRGLAYNRINNHVLVVSRTGGNAIHVLDGDTGAHLWSMNVDPNIVQGGTFALNLVEVTDDGVVYAANLVQDGNFKVYRWLDDSETSIPELVWGPGNPSGDAAVVRWGDAMDLRGVSLPQLVLTSRNSNYVSIIELWDLNLPPKVAHVAELEAGVLGLGVAFGADPQSGGFTIWGTSSGNALRQIELVEDPPNVLTPTVIRSFPGYLPMANIGVEPASNLLAGVSVDNPDNVRLVDIVNATSGDVDTVDTEFFPTDNVNANGTGNVAFGPNRIYALASNNGIMAWSYSYERPACVPGNLTITRTSPTEIEISWSQAGQRLESTSDLSATPTWNTAGNSSPVTIPIGTGNVFYRLVCP